MSDTNGNRTLNGQLIGYDVLEWTQAERLERIARARVGLAHECGWVAEWVGPYPNLGWEVFATGASVLGTRSEDAGVPDDPYPIDRTRPISPFIGIDRLGQVLEIPTGARLLDDADAEIEPPDDGVWRTLVARYALTRREPGKLTLVGGSTSIVGVGTQFTRYSTSPEPTILRIDETETLNGNEGSYVIDTITDDENMTVISAPPNSEDDVSFRVKGQFISGEPADPDIHNVATVRWELVTRTTERPADGLIAYDVRQSGGVVTLMDRRRGSLYQPYSGRSSSFALVPAWTGFNNATNAVLVQRETISLVTGGAAGTGIYGLSMAPASTGSHLGGLAEDQPTGVMMAILYDTGAARQIRVKNFTMLETDAANGSSVAGRWDDPDNGAVVDVITAAGLLDVSLVALPIASGFTHVCFYVTSAGAVVAKTSADNGNTWVGPSAVWTPSGGATVIKMHAHLTRLNRLVIVAQVSTASRIRAVYSDDLGATWDTNTNAGYAIGDSATIHDVSVTEDDRGNLWTVTAQSTTNALRIFRGASEGDAVPGAGDEVSGWKIGSDGASGTAIANHVAVFPLPNGMVGAVCDLGSVLTEGKRLVYVNAARRNAVYHQTLVLAPNTIEDDPMDVAACVTASGVVFLAWGDRTVGNDADVRIIRLVPAAIERAHTWYGGT